MFYKNFMRADAPIQIREEKFYKNFGLNNRKGGSKNDEIGGNRYPDFHASFPDLIMISSENAEKGGFPTTTPLMGVIKIYKFFYFTTIDIKND